MSVPIGSLALTPEEYTFSKVFIKHQIRPNPRPASLESVTAAGQTAIVTGGNAGLGLECSKILLSIQLGHLVLAVRSAQRGEAAAALLRKQHPKATVEVWSLDLSSYKSIVAFANKCKTLPRLDMVIHSAGIMNTRMQTTESTGHEEMFQVNYLSTALLSILILPVLAHKSSNPAGKPGRLTLVASGAALIADFAERDADALIPAFDDYARRGVSAKQRYDTSKGLVLMLTLKLSRLVRSSAVVVNVVDPSFTPGTNFFRDVPLTARALLWPLLKFLGTTVNNAAWRYMDAAVARGEESHGSFLSDWEIHRYHAFMYTTEGDVFMDRLWAETVKELDHLPEVRDALESLLQAEHVK